MDPTLLNVQTFQYICRCLKPALDKMDTNYHLSVLLQKRVAVAVWKLATKAEYRSVAHLFGVGISTACDCVKDFCSSVETILLPEVIQMPNAEKLKELSLYFEQRWGLPQCVGLLMAPTSLFWLPRNTTQNISIEKGDIPLSCRQLMMEKVYSGMFLQATRQFA